MPLDIKTLCQYRLNRAKEDLLTAENNHQAGFYKAAINRSFERGVYKMIDSAYRIREKCDYSDFFIASKADSEIQLKHAHDFISVVETYLDQNASLPEYHSED